MARRINIAITGLGHIGKHIAELLGQRHAHYLQAYQLDVRIVGACGSSSGIADPDGLATAQLLNRDGWTPGLNGSRFMDAVAADILFEASPTDLQTGGAALAYMKEALAKGSHIIAISKGALALDFASLKAQAEARGLALKMSGAIGSSLPLLDLVRYALAGSRIKSVEAIVTGTTNIILSEMMQHARSFDDALRMAQDLGVAEADPTLDTHGWDTACKIAIFANEAFGTDIKVHEMARQGIDQLTLDDVQRWREAGVMPRLVGRIYAQENGYQAEVALETYPAEHPFAQIQSRMKAVHIVTELAGDVALTVKANSPYGTAVSALKDLEQIFMAR